MKKETPTATILSKTSNLVFKDTSDITMEKMESERCISLMELKKNWESENPRNRYMKINIKMKKY